MASTPTNDEEPTIGSQVAPGVIFILTGLEQLQKNLNLLEPEPVKRILESPINLAGRVQAVYLISECSNGYYEVKTHAKAPAGSSNIGRIWADLHRTGSIMQNDTEAVLWHQTGGLSSLFQALPANSRKIGAFSGYQRGVTCLDDCVAAAPSDQTAFVANLGALSGKQRGHTHLDDYVATAPNDQTLVFLVGEFYNEEIQRCIDDYVEVSQYQLSADLSLSYICVALATKWNITIPVNSFDQNRLGKRKMEREVLRQCSRVRLYANSGHGGIKEGDDESREIVESPENVIKNKDSIYEFPLIPRAPSNQNTNPGVTFVLERASLVPAYVGRRYMILNPEIHADFLRKKKMDPYKCRPDIVHEALLQIMNSRLTMAGRLHAVYIKTDEGVLIKVEPHAHIPEFKDFCAMMSQLLQKFRIKSTSTGKALWRVVKNPLMRHLPVNSLKIGFSFSSEKKVHLQDYVNAINNNVHLVFVVGAMAHGKIDNENVDDFISVSDYPLSAWACLDDICIALERKWNIL